MQESKMEQLWRSGHISGGNAAYVEELYEKYLEDPSDVPDQWRSYFETLPMVEGAMAPDISHSTVRDHFLLLSKNQSRVTPVSPASINAEHERKEMAVGELISGYRRRGHLKANLDPLELEEKPNERITQKEYYAALIEALGREDSNSFPSSAVFGFPDFNLDHMIIAFPSVITH